MSCGRGLVGSACPDQPSAVSADRPLPACFGHVRSSSAGLAWGSLFCSQENSSVAAGSAASAVWVNAASNGPRAPRPSAWFPFAAGTPALGAGSQPVLAPQPSALAESADRSGSGLARPVLLAAGAEMPGSPALRPAYSERVWPPRSAALIRSG